MLVDMFDLFQGYSQFPRLSKINCTDYTGLIFQAASQLDLK